MPNNPNDLVANPRVIFSKDYLDNLDKEVREEALNKIIEKIVQASPHGLWSNVQQALIKVIDKNTVSMDVDKLLEITPLKLAEEILQLTSECGCVRQLISADPSNSRTDEVTPKKFIRNNIFKQFLTLKFLQEICIRRYFLSFEQVKHLCQSVPTLSKIDVAIEPHDPEDFKEDVSILNFGNIRVLLFSMLWSDHIKKYEYQEELTRLIVVNLPKVEVAGSPRFFADLTSVIDHVTCESNIRSLNIRMADPESAIRSFHNFPHVESLNIDFVDGYSFLMKNFFDIKPMLGFRMLKHIQMSGLRSTSYLDRVLKSYNSTLNSLKIFSNVKINLVKIISMCQALTIAEFSEIGLTKNEKKAESFVRLKVLKVAVCRENIEAIDIVSICKLGQSIETLELTGCKFIGEDLKEIQVLAKRREILQTVKVLKLDGIITGKRKRLTNMNYENDVRKLTEQLHSSYPLVQITLKLVPA